MKRWISVLTGAMILLWILSPAGVLAAEPQLFSAAEAGNAFGLALFKQAARSEEGSNIFISPYSISTALAMTYTGARGKTADEMATVLNYSVTGEPVHAAVQALTENIEKSRSQGCALYVANALWGQKDFGFKDEFLGLIQKYYGGGFNTVDFIGQKEQTRTRINKWVLNNTAEKIRNLITPDDTDEDTRMVLTNAIYFKGDWDIRFDKKMTQKSPFHAGPEKTVDADMMFREGDYLYAAPNDTLQMIELPYKGDELAMVILLPRNGLQDLEEILNAQNLNGWLAGMHTEAAEVFLPRFKFQSRYYLGGLLNALGMREAFTKRADFSGMNGRDDLYVGKVIHQADIDVNEEGTEAAAATAVVMQEKSMPMRIRFKADHPFVFLIRHKPTNAILFMGQLTDPNEGKDKQN